MDGGSSPSSAATATSDGNEAPMRSLSILSPLQVRSTRSIDAAPSVCCGLRSLCFCGLCCPNDGRASRRLLLSSPPIEFASPPHFSLLSLPSFLPSLVLECFWLPPSLVRSFLSLMAALL